MSWQTRVKRVVDSLCRESYLQANTAPNGKRYKKHRPYSVPDVAVELIECLNTDNEESAKAIMIYDYHASKF